MKTPRLNLPYIAPTQAQKHITHNEALRQLDAVVQIGVQSDSWTDPPETPHDGQSFIIPLAAAEPWDAYENHLAVLQDGAWAYYPPQIGWQAWISDRHQLQIWDGSEWVNSFNAQNLPVLGIQSTADENNRLSVCSPATLFNHDGADHQIKINKSTAENTASILYQTDYSGRGEIGLTGDDNLHLRVSADGTTFKTAQTWIGGSALTQFPPFAREDLPAAPLTDPGTIAFLAEGLSTPEFVFSDGTHWRKFSTLDIVHPSLAYSTLDPNMSATAVILSNNNQDIQVNTSTWASARGTLSHNSGQYYFEVLLVTLAVGANTLVGVCDDQSTAYNLGTHPGNVAQSLAVRNDKMFSTGFTELTPTPPYSPLENDTMRIAVDFESGSIWFGLNDNWFTGTPSPSATTGRNGTFPPNTPLFPLLGCAGTVNKARLVTDATLFTHSPPAGFAAWG